MGLRVPITSQLTRKMALQSFRPSSVMSWDVYRDTVYKGHTIKVSGSIVSTFGSGTPVSDDRSSIGTMINYIDVSQNGSTYIKNVTPWMMHVQELIATGNFGVRKGQANSSSPIDVAADSKFVYGTTTQASAFVDQILISYQNPLCGKGTMDTLWDARGLASAEIRLSTASYLEAFLGYGNTAPVSYSNANISVEIQTLETQNIPVNYYFSMFKQTSKQVSFTAPVNNFLVDINRGNYLQGLLFEAHNGSAGSPTTATGRALSDLLVKSFELKINGSLSLQQVDWQELQQKIKNRFGINAPYVNGLSFLTGIAYMDLLEGSDGAKFGALSSAQDVTAPLVDSVQLGVTTNAAGTGAGQVPYTDTAYLNILTNEIVPPVRN